MTDKEQGASRAHSQSGVTRIAELFWTALRLGLTSFGGPVAHLGYFREEYVSNRKWLEEDEYVDLVALCQFLPGPASSQVGIGVGIRRAGLLGGFVAWLGFTMPSAIALIAFAYGVSHIGDVAGAGWLHGLKVVAVAVVAYAVWGMARNLAPDKRRMTIAAAGAVTLLFWQSAYAQLAVIAAGGLIGWQLIPRGSTMSGGHGMPIGKRLGIAALVTFFGLLIALPIAAGIADNRALDVFKSFYQSGSLVFGGGHVVLPLLQSQVVPPGWVTNDQFIAGYGAAQAVPGPLFTFSSYLGATIDFMPTRWLGGLFALGAIYVPSFLLVTGALPFWSRLRSFTGFQRAMAGVNAAVVGLLLAALYNPVWTSAILGPRDFALGVAAFVLLAWWKVPPWLVVVLAALGGEAVSRI